MILEARSFNHSATLLLQALKNPPKKTSKFISMPEATLNQMSWKSVCFLYSVAIELFLKGIYSEKKSPEDQETTESFGHKVLNLNQKLIAKGIFKKDELNIEALELANIILEWSGRYTNLELKRLIE